MQVVYARKNLSSRQEIYTAGGAIFLAGPTPRNIHVDSWRSEALGLLDDAGFSGYVFVPEDIRGGMRGDKRRQREWEWSAIEAADTVLFWVPRNLVDMPAFTTNIEFGYLACLTGLRRLATCLRFVSERMS